MAFGYVSHTTPYNSSSSAAATINAPAGVADNDLLFTLIKHSANESPNSVPSGWTLLGEMYNIASSSMNSLYMKVASSEPASYDWGWATAARTGIVCIAFRDGFDTADPIDAVSNTKYSTNDTTVRAASMTVAAEDSPIIFFAQVHASATQSFTPPSSPSAFTEHVDDWGSGSRANFCIASMIWASSGATGDIDATNTLTVADAKHAFAVSLNPPPAGGPPPEPARRVTLLMGPP